MANCFQGHVASLFNFNGRIMPMEYHTLPLDAICRCMYRLTVKVVWTYHLAALHFTWTIAFHNSAKLFGGESDLESRVYERQTTSLNLVCARHDGLWSFCVHCGCWPGYAVCCALCKMHGLRVKTADQSIEIADPSQVT